jgi:hypothetical protein
MKRPEVIDTTIENVDEDEFRKIVDYVNYLENRVKEFESAPRTIPVEIGETTPIPSREEVWLRVAIAIIGDSKCDDRYAPAYWANQVLKDFDERFNKVIE